VSAKDEIMEKKIPIDFWGIGAHKSGTTWLYRQLKLVPGFDMLPIKELHYFDRNPKYLSLNTLSEPNFFRRLGDFKWMKKAIIYIPSAVKKGRWNDFLFFIKWYFSYYNDDWYLSLFKFFNSVTGEITPEYSMLNKEEIKTMYKLSPNAKLILLLRNPIDRAWSQYRFEKRKIKNFSVDTSSDEEIIEFMESEFQSLRSDYIRTINNFSSIFPKDQILIGFYDAIIDDPERLLIEITNFIGVKSENSIKELPLKAVANKSVELECPSKVNNYLKARYHDQIKELADQYGGYFNKWYQETYNSNSTNSNTLLFPTIMIDNAKRSDSFRIP